MRLPWTTKQDLREQVAALEAQIERAEKIDTSVKLLKAGAEPDKSFMLQLHSELWPLIAHSLYTWFKENGGKNYIEQTVSVPKDDDHKASMTFKVFDFDPYFNAEVFTLTMQRLSGKTPHQLKAAAEAEVVRLKARVAELEGRA